MKKQKIQEGVNMVAAPTKKIEKMARKGGEPLQTAEAAAPGERMLAVAESDMRRILDRLAVLEQRIGTQTEIAFENASTPNPAPDTRVVAEIYRKEEGVLYTSSPIFLAPSTDTAAAEDTKASTPVVTLTPFNPDDKNGPKVQPEVEMPFTGVPLSEVVYTQEEMDIFRAQSSGSWKKYRVYLKDILTVLSTLVDLNQVERSYTYNSKMLQVSASMTLAAEEGSAIRPVITFVHTMDRTIPMSIHIGALDTDSGAFLYREEYTVIPGILSMPNLEHSFREVMNVVPSAMKTYRDMVYTLEGLVFDYLQTASVVAKCVIFENIVTPHMLASIREDITLLKDKTVKAISLYSTISGAITKHAQPRNITEFLGNAARLYHIIGEETDGRKKEKAA